MPYAKVSNHLPPIIPTSTSSFAGCLQGRRHRETLRGAGEDFHTGDGLGWSPLSSGCTVLFGISYSDHGGVIFEPIHPKTMVWLFVCQFVLLFSLQEVAINWGVPHF